MVPLRYGRRAKGFDVKATGLSYRILGKKEAKLHRAANCSLELKLHQTISLTSELFFCRIQAARL